MRTILLNKLKMYLMVQGVFQKHSAWKKSAPFTAATAELDKGVSDIDAKNMSLGNVSSVNQAKKQAKNLMLDNALLVCSAAKTYAYDIKDDGLVATFNFSRSDLAAGSDHYILLRCQKIANAGGPLLGHLEGYNLTQQVFDKLDEATAKFDNLLIAPQITARSNKSGNEELETIFRATDALLKNRLDNMMELYKTANPDFYLEYQDARYIGGRGKGSKEEKPETPTV